MTLNQFSAAVMNALALIQSWITTVGRLAVAIVATALIVDVAGWNIPWIATPAESWHSAVLLAGIAYALGR